MIEDPLSPVAKSRVMIDCPVIGPTGQIFGRQNAFGQKSSQKNWTRTRGFTPTGELMK
jgi:hypothetical protein